MRNYLVEHKNKKIDGKIHLFKIRKSFTQNQSKIYLKIVMLMFDLLNDEITSSIKEYLVSSIDYINKNKQNKTNITSYFKIKY